MGIFVKHEPCPKCGSRDNLARYMDGSAWCFGCGHRERADKIPVIDDKWLEKEDESIQLASDLCFDFPGHVVSWLGQYDISVEEAIKHGWKYSPHFNQLSFIFYGEAGEIALVQSRNFTEGKKKYFNQGSAKNVLPIFRAGEMPDSGGAYKTLVVVEDAVSAARIARQTDAMPCLGSYLPKNKQRALKLLGYEELSIWLDEDKLKEARNIADQCKWLGFNTRVIYTEKDPKEYTNEEISGWLKQPYT